MQDVIQAPAHERREAAGIPILEGLHHDNHRAARADNPERTA
jgi:hypothetical protein